MQIPSLPRIRSSDLRLRYALGLRALPILFSVAMMFLAYLTLLAILPSIGVGPDISIDVQDRGGLAMVVLIVVLSLAFLIGSIFGFFANAVVCRYFLKWDKEQVLSVFYDSKVPEKWRKS